MRIATAASRKAAEWRDGDITWEEFARRASTTTPTPETMAEYRAMGREEQTQAKDRGGYVLGRLRDGHRRAGCVESRSAIALDLDWCPQDAWRRVEQALEGVEWVGHTTHKHTPEHPRLRVIIPLRRDVTEAEYPAVARRVAERIGIDMCDDSTFQAQRLMFWPTTSRDGAFETRRGHGAPLDPDRVLAEYADWRDASQWPRSSRVSSVERHGAGKAPDPRGKKGAVGAFCRTYTIEEAIDRFLPDVYEPTQDPGRYHYRPADSGAGLVCYGHVFAYSNHATDPAACRLLNAFDLVRVHKYRQLDAALPEDTPVAALPSYKAMRDTALQDPAVKDTLARENDPAADFTPAAGPAGTPDAETDADGGDWRRGLTYAKDGGVADTLDNARLILARDPRLECIVRNELADALEVKGQAPWKRPASPRWRDEDDDQLLCWLNDHYGRLFGDRVYHIALGKIADDRSYHPVRDYLQALPEWDGEHRVDTLLADYLGAEDTGYTRAVTRKVLVAAVRRIRVPGEKFDTMLVLNGPQGIGKSTLIARLGGKWFSDSLILSDTRDKTAAEKLQGYWILEIGEMAGYRAADEETLKSFLSRVDDKYRPSYGRNVVPHPRQCVFIATTNAEDGFLRSAAGNRRFWPVHTPGGGRLESWDMTQATVDQIWAEAKALEAAGEPLTLGKALAREAEERQTQALEGDERESLVARYLDTPRPAGWASMGVAERRAWLEDPDPSHGGRPGEARVDVVCNLEVWCECFGKPKADLTRMEGARIKRIMTKLGWRRRTEGKISVPGYDAQWVYERPAAV